MSSFGEQSPEEMISTTTTSEGQPKANKDSEIQPQRAYYGLYNQGSTCYLNSVLQVLYMTTEMHHRLDPKSQITDQELGDLFEKLKEETCTTGNITRTLEIKNVKEQRDAAECLEMILYKVSPQASGVFQGQLRYTTKCSKDHIINEETNPFWTLPLSLQDTPDSTYSVENHFKRIFHEKTYDGDNKVYCNECGDKTEAKSRCEMVGSPQILILLLKRFDFDFNTMSHFKSDRCVDVPCELQTKVKTYKLYGMVNHMGGLNGGHYTSTILSDEDKSWYEFNDTSVTKVKEQPFAETKSHNSGTVYLLMYRATESQMSSEAINPDDLRRDDAEQKERNSEERVADNEDETPVKQSEQDEVQAGSDEVLNHQTRGEREETGEKDLTNDGRSESEVTGEQLIKPRNEKEDSVGESPCDRLGSHNEDDEPDVRSAAENSHDVSMKTGESCDLKSGEGEEGQGNQSDGSHSNIAQENTTSKSEESKETRGEDVEEQSKDSCEQHLDKETEPVMQKQRTVGEVKTSGGEEGQGDQSDGSHSNIAQENTTSKSEELKETRGEDVGEQSKDSCEQHLDKETEPVMQKQRTVGEVKTSGGEEGQGDQSDGSHSNIAQENTTSKSEESKETRGEDVGEQSKDSCEQHLDKETEPVMQKQRTVGEVKTSGGEEGQGDQSDGSQSNIAQENTTSKSEESKETRGEDVGEQSKDSCEQHLDKETEPVMQKQRTVGEVKTSGGEEAWGDLFGNRAPEESKDANVEEAVVGVGEQSKVEQLLDKQTKTWKQKQSGFPSKSTKSQNPVDATSENHTDVEKEDNVEGVGPEELKGDDEHKQNASQIIPDDEETTQTAPREKGEGQMREDKEDEKHQARGEEGEAESVENETSVQAQGDLSGNEDGTDSSIRRGNREEVREEDAVVGVGEQLKDSSEQRTNEETTTETQEQGASKSQKPAETTGLADEVEEEQGEDKLKGGEVEHGRKTGEIDDGDGERESEEQMRRD